MATDFVPLIPTGTLLVSWDLWWDVVSMFPNIIVSRGDWLGNSANFKGTCLCLRFSTSRDIDPAHNISRWRPYSSVSDRCFEVYLACSRPFFELLIRLIRKVVYL